MPAKLVFKSDDTARIDQTRANLMALRQQLAAASKLSGLNVTVDMKAVGAQLTSTLTDKSITAASFYGLPVATEAAEAQTCLLYTSPSPRDRQKSRMPSSA